VRALRVQKAGASRFDNCGDPEFWCRGYVRQSGKVSGRGVSIRSIFSILPAAQKRSRRQGKHHRMTLFAGLTAMLTLILGAIALIDLRHFRIPDMLSLPLIAAGLALALWLPDLPFWPRLAGAVAGFAILGAIGAWYYRRTGTDGLGLGDAKLFAAAGAWLGWQALPAVLLIAALGGLAFAAVAGRTDRHEAIAFGPWLALGFWVVWLWQTGSFHVSV
jgi:leader peptidase (prepilin peptidase) / N-methyltransferase